MAAIEEAVVEPDDDCRDALLNEAIAAFYATLVERPDLVRVRLELRLLLQGQDSVVGRRFVKVLAGCVWSASFSRLSSR